jgi:hypothetical protein
MLRCQAGRHRGSSLACSRCRAHQGARLGFPAPAPGVPARTRHGRRSSPDRRPVTRDRSTWSRRADRDASRTALRSCRAECASRDSRPSCPRASCGGDHGENVSPFPFHLSGRERRLSSGRHLEAVRADDCGMSYPPNGWVGPGLDSRRVSPRLSGGGCGKGHLRVSLPSAPERGAELRLGPHSSRFAGPRRSLRYMSEARRPMSVDEWIHPTSASRA